MRILPFFIVAAAICSAQKMPHFQDYAIKVTFSKRPARIDLTKYHFAHGFGKALQEGANAGPNFSDHFTIFQMPEPSACYSCGIVDAASGKLYFFPGISGCGNLVVSRNSRLLITEAMDSATYTRIGGKRFSYDWTRFYEWTGSRFVQIDSTQSPLDFLFEPLHNMVSPPETPVEHLATKVSATQFQQLRWLVGQWRELWQNSRVSLFFRISLANESQVEMEQFTDSTFTSQSDVTFISLDSNRVYMTSGESRWVCTQLDRNHVSFIALNSTDSRPPTMTIEKSKNGNSFNTTTVWWDDKTGKRTKDLRVASPIK